MLLSLPSVLHARILSFASGGRTLTFLYIVDEGRDDPHTTKQGNHLPASETPLNGVSLAGRILNASVAALKFFRGSGPVLLRNAVFWYFTRVGRLGSPAPSPVWIRAGLVTVIFIYMYIVMMFKNVRNIIGVVCYQIL